MIILREKPAFDEFPVVENPITGHVSNVVTLCLNLTLRILHEHTWLKDVWFREVVKVWGVVDALDLYGNGSWSLSGEKISEFKEFDKLPKWNFAFENMVAV